MDRCVLPSCGREKLDDFVSRFYRPYHVKIIVCTKIRRLWSRENQCEASEGMIMG